MQECAYSYSNSECCEQPNAHSNAAYGYLPPATLLLRSDGAPNLPVPPLPVDTTRSESSAQCARSARRAACVGTAPEQCQKVGGCGTPSPKGPLRRLTLNQPSHRYPALPPAFARATGYAHCSDVYPQWNSQLADSLTGTGSLCTCTCSTPPSGGCFPRGRLLAAFFLRPARFPLVACGQPVKAQRPPHHAETVTRPSI